MNQAEFLKAYNKEQYDRPSVAVDLVLFTVKEGALSVVLTKRDQHPFMGMLSLPGTFVGVSESLDEAVARCLNQKMGLSDIYFEQLYTWGEVDRDPRMRIISVSYYALIPEGRLTETDKGSEIREQLYPVDALTADDTFSLAFDHKKIIAYGRERIRNKVEYSDIAFELLPEYFTLPQLQSIHEILLGKPLYKANFRKKMADRVTPTDRMANPDGHRPGRIYNKKEEATDHEKQ